jgi:hypothetical protein
MRWFNLRPAIAPQAAQPVAVMDEKLAEHLSMAIGIILSNKMRIGYMPDSPVGKFVKEAAKCLEHWPVAASPTPPLPQGQNHIVDATKMVPLTDEVIAEIYKETYPDSWMADGSLRKFARAIEAAHGIGPEQEGA